MKPKFVLFILSLFICGTLSSRAENTNFVVAAKAAWQSHDYTNFLEFAQCSVQTNPCVEAYLVRGISAVYLESWSRGATNFLEQAIL